MTRPTIQNPYHHANTDPGPNEYPEAVTLIEWRQEGFRVQLHQPAHTTPLPDGTWFGYRLYDDTWATLTGSDPLIFAGTDLGLPAHQADLPQAVQALCAYLSLQPGDVNAGYFRTYTPEQLTWCEARAADLASLTPTRSAKVAANSEV